MKIWLDKRERKATLFSRFVDSFLADSRGDEIKVYCVLLNLAVEEEYPGGNSCGEITPAELAERLDITEKSVQRCLKTWEKRGLIQRKQTEDFGETEIILTVPEAEVQEESPAFAETESESAPSGEKTAKTTFYVPQETRVRLKKDEEFQDLIHEFSVFMSKPLTPTQADHLMYLFGELDLGYEVLHYLLELCVVRSERAGKKKMENFRYFEKIALDWHEKGIRDLEAARREGTLYPKEFYEILRECGVSTSGRVIRPYEENFFNRWLYEYGFAMPIVKEAVRRSFKNKGDQKVSLEYIDAILSGWYKAGVKTLADVEKQDEMHRQSQALKEKSASASGSARNRAANPFTDYEQRVYDYDVLMQKLRGAGKP